MKQITIIGNENQQVFRISIPETKKYIDVLLVYSAQQQGWFINFQYESFSINGLRIVTSGNFLHQFRNILPFGMACVTEGNEEPMLKDDFSSKRAILYLLTSSEVKAFYEVVSGKTST